MCVGVHTSKAPSFVYNPINVTKVTLLHDKPRRSLRDPDDFFLLSFCDSVSAEFPWCADDGFHVRGFLMVLWTIKPRIQTLCKEVPKQGTQCLFVVWVHKQELTFI